jgi:hypothetical protein
VFVSKTYEAQSLHDKLHANPKSHSHVVQFYEADEQLLSRNVSRFLREGLQKGEGVLVIASAERRDAFCLALRYLAVDFEAAVTSGRLTLLDAQEALNSFMVDRRLDRAKFLTTIGALVREIRERTGYTGLRAYGEMVGLLWSAGHYSAAIELEECWNELVPSIGFSLFCGYPIDVFGREFQADSIYALLCDHTHVLPTGVNDGIERAVNQAIDEILGSRGQGLRLGIKTKHPTAWAAIPSAEAQILWLRNNVPDSADDVLNRARQLYHSAKLKSRS